MNTLGAPVGVNRPNQDAFGGRMGHVAQYTKHIHAVRCASNRMNSTQKVTLASLIRTGRARGLGEACSRRIINQSCHHHQESVFFKETWEVPSNRGPQYLRIACSSRVLE